MKIIYIQKSKAMPVTGVVPVRYEYLLHIKNKAMPVTGEFPVRYEHLHIKK
jgi:hypothetical protein